MRIVTLCREALAQIGPVATTTEIADWATKNYRVISKEQVSAAMSRASRDPNSNIVHIGGPRSGTFALATTPTSNGKPDETQYREFEIKAFITDEEVSSQYLDTNVILGVAGWLVKNWATDEPSAIGPEEEALLDLLDEQIMPWISQQLPDNVADARLFAMKMMATAAAILYESALEFALAFDPREDQQ